MTDRDRQFCLDIGAVCAFVMTAVKVAGVRELVGADVVARVAAAADRLWINTGAVMRRDP